MNWMTPTVERHPPVRLPRPVLLIDAGGVFLWPRLEWARQRLRERGVEVGLGRLFEGYCLTIRKLDRYRLEHGAAAYPSESSAEAMTAFLGGVVPPTELEALGRWMSREVEETFPRGSDWWNWTLPWTRGVLERLRREFPVLGVVSNNDGGLVGQIQHHDLDVGFDVLVDSGVVGVAKPDPEILRIALERLGRKPEDCTFVGDVFTLDGWAARDAGIPFRLIDPLGLYREDSVETVPSLAHIVRDPR